MLENLTIVIYTYDRYPYLKRLLSFYLSYNSSAKFLILDSSENVIEDEDLLSMLSGENITWKKFSPDVFFLKKIAKGSKLIQTDYAVLSTDDDFLILPALEECKEFLKKNIDYSSVQGLSFLHDRYMSKGELNLRLIPFHGGEALSVQEESASSRVSSYLTKGKFYPMYAVHRKIDFCSIWQESNLYVDHQGLSELLPCCLSLIKGKMKVLPSFYNLREPNNYISWQDEETLSRVYSQERLKRASEGLAKNLCKESKFAYNEVLKFSEGLFNEYLELSSLKRLKLKKSNTATLRFISNLRLRLKVRSRIKDLIYKILYQGSHPTIYPKYVADFLKVKKIILDYNLGFEELNLARKKAEYL